MKRCSKCGEWKDEGEFSPDRRKKSGVRSACRECNKASCLSYYYAHHDQCRAANKAWYREHKEYQAQRHRDWVAKNQDKIKARSRIYQPNYYKEHRSESLEYAKSYRLSSACDRTKELARRYFTRVGILPTQELVDLKAKQIALVRAIRKQKEAKA